MQDLQKRILTLEVKKWKFEKQERQTSSLELQVKDRTRKMVYHHFDTFIGHAFSQMLSLSFCSVRLRKMC